MRIIRWPTRALLWLALAGLSALAGCNSIRLAYDHAPRLTWWWLDGYVDFNSEQTPQVKAAIDDFYAWHRQTQLPQYATLVAELQAPLLHPTTGTVVCRWQDRIQEALQPAIERALKTTAERLPVLTEDEFDHIRKRYDKNNLEFRKDFMQADPDSRAEAAFERSAERAERIYGKLDATQKALIRKQIAGSPFDPALSLAERQRRQRDTIETLRRLQADGAGSERRLDALRGLGERAQASPEPVHRSYQEQLRRANCEFIAQLHNATTRAQRAKAQETVRGYLDDLRALMAVAE